MKSVRPSRTSALVSRIFVCSRREELPSRVPREAITTAGTAIPMPMYASTMTIPNALRPRVRYASRAAPGPPENATKKTPIPMRSQGARKPTISMRARILPAGRTLPLLELPAHPVQRVADQARHVHLRDPDPLGDLGLGQ